MLQKLRRAVECMQELSIVLQSYFLASHRASLHRGVAAVSVSTSYIILLLVFFLLMVIFLSESMATRDLTNVAYIRRSLEHSSLLISK
jgi:hypothetical protein